MYETLKCPCRWTAVFVGNMFQDLPRLRKTADNTERYIQGDSGGICTTLGNDSMSDSKQKSSYEHVSDFERLRSYGHFLIPVHALM